MEIKQFRHKIAVLKKKGLVSGVDARTVKPTPHLTRLVNRFDDVTSGKATPVKLSKTETANLKAAGYDVFKGRVLFPHSAGEKIAVKKGHVSVRQGNGVERVTIPIPYHGLDAYFDEIEKNQEFIDNMKRKDEYFAFRFYGHKSNAIFRNVDLLTEYLREYRVIEESRRNSDAKSMNEIYRNVEIYKAHRAKDWDSFKSGKRKTNKYDSSDYNKQKKKRAKEPDWKKAQRREANAAKSAAYRANLSATEKERYLAKARKRRRRSDANKKKTRST